MARATGGAPQFVDARRIHPWWMKGLNAVGGLMPRHARLSAAELWEQASKHPRLHSVRPTSAAREALEVLVDSINREARLCWVGRLIARDDTLRLARTHLRINQSLAKDPLIVETPLPAAIFILGLPRTGTTFLHQLLA
jgi:hypothetical protein